MAEKQRKKLISDIEKERGSRVITYVTSNRPNVQSEIEGTDIIHFRQHLEKICKTCNSIDLFIYSYGGELEAAWELVNLIREYNVDFNKRVYKYTTRFVPSDYLPHKTSVEVIHFSPCDGADGSSLLSFPNQYTCL